MKWIAEARRILPELESPQRVEILADALRAAHEQGREAGRTDRERLDQSWARANR